MYSIKGFTPRLYQETILHTATMKNVLVVLPTGMGKTKTAMLIAIHRLNNYPNSKVFFLTPTKPLASQICEEFKKNTTIDEDKIVLFTGTVSPEKREEMWKDATVVVSTPQTAANDLVNSRISVKDVSCLVIDEAHLAVGDYDYNFVAKQYHKLANYPKIIALTASPGSDLAKIAEVCTNLHIEEIEVRTSDDPDVKPYVQELDIEYV
ncbi:MAG: DEAD/DEAH box helicase, partial [Nanoarchaeota archaeon]